MFDLLN